MLAKLQQYFLQHIHPEQSNDGDHALQLAAAVLLIELSLADFSRDDEENAAMTKALKQTFALDDARIKELISLAEDANRQATSLYQFTQLINQHYDDNQKYRLIEMLWQVAMADGEISKYEDHLIRKIAELIYVPHREFIRAKLAVLGED